jgi:hypothetical protein
LHFIQRPAFTIKVNTLRGGGKTGAHPQAEQRVKTYSLWPILMNLIQSAV